MNETNANVKPGETDEEAADREKLESRLNRIKHRILVLSGKGGVGKSTMAVNLAVGLMMEGKRVGLLDVDIHGPSIPTMLGLEGSSVQVGVDGLVPITVRGIKVLSLGFFLRKQDDAVIWRGPLKMNVIRQFLKDVDWGDLDFLIVDSPPGTGDEPLSVCQLIGSLDGAVIVTTPQKVAAVDVRKSITFCRKLGVPVLGVVENMSGFKCPACGEITPILGKDGGRRIAEDMGIPFLGSIPIDPKVAEASDTGQAFIVDHRDSPAALEVKEIIAPIVALQTTMRSPAAEAKEKPKEEQMKFAVPLADGKLAQHFGHCERFALIDVDPETRTIRARLDIEAPPHEPGLLPRWLSEQGATHILAGGMGQRAQGLFSEQGIQVLVGAPSESPERLVEDYLAERLSPGENPCDH